MRKAKKATLDEKLKIVLECLKSNKNYGAMALQKKTFRKVRWKKHVNSCISAITDQSARSVLMKKRSRSRKNITATLLCCRTVKRIRLTVSSNIAGTRRSSSFSNPANRGPTETGPGCGRASVLWGGCLCCLLLYVTTNT